MGGYHTLNIQITPSSTNSGTLFHFPEGGELGGGKGVGGRGEEVGWTPLNHYDDDDDVCVCSWSPSGVLMAARNPAKYIKDNKVVEV